jgi:hypothetical protein
MKAKLLRNAGKIGRVTEVEIGTRAGTNKVRSDKDAGGRSTPGDSGHDPSQLATQREIPIAASKGIWERERTERSQRHQRADFFRGRLAAF